MTKNESVIRFMIDEDGSITPAPSLRPTAETEIYEDAEGREYLRLSYWGVRDVIRFSGHEVAQGLMSAEWAADAVYRWQDFLEIQCYLAPTRWARECLALEERLWGANYKEAKSLRKKLYPLASEEWGRVVFEIPASLFDLLFPPSEGALDREYAIREARVAAGKFAPSLVPLLERLQADERLLRAAEEEPFGALILLADAAREGGE